MISSLNLRNLSISYNLLLGENNISNLGAKYISQLTNLIWLDLCIINKKN